MKRLILSCSAILIAGALFSSCSNSKKSFTIKGSISGFTGQTLVLSYYDQVSGSMADTIPVKDGSFGFTGDLSAPASALLQGANFSKAIAIAPDYDLKITANAVTNAISYDGKGASSNKFLTKVDTVDISRYFVKRMPKKEFIDSLKKARIVEDVAVSIFGGNEADKEDPYYTYFVNVASYDSTFKRFRYAIQYLDENFAQFTEAEADSLISQNFDQKVVKDLSDASLLNSPAFREMMGNDHHYVFYQAKVNLRKDTSRVVDHDYFLKTIDQSFKGKVRNYVRDNFLRNNLIARGRAAGG